MSPTSSLSTCQLSIDNSKRDASPEDFTATRPPAANRLDENLKDQSGNLICENLRKYLRKSAGSPAEPATFQKPKKQRSPFNKKKFPEFG